MSNPNATCTVPVVIVCKSRNCKTPISYNEVEVQRLEEEWVDAPFYCPDCLAHEAAGHVFCRECDAYHSLDAANWTRSGECAAYVERNRND